MDKKSIKNKIDILLENYSIKPSPDFKNKETGSEFTIEVIIEPEKDEVEESPQKFEYVNKQIMVLKNWYVQLSPKEKEIFEEVLMEYLKPNAPARFKMASFLLLIHLGYFDKAFKYIETELKLPSQRDYFLLLIDLSQILKYEWFILRSAETEHLHRWLDEVLGEKNELGKNTIPYLYSNKQEIKIIEKLYRQINVIRANSLISEIQSGFNPQINIDEKELKEGFARFGFPKDLSDTLDKIDQKISTAGDGFDFKSCMDLIRSFTERFYKTVATSMDTAEGGKMNEKDSEKVAAFFIKHGLLSEEQGKILISLRHFMSNLGSHRLKSKPEDSRLSRNMTIEFTFYVLKRFEESNKGKGRIEFDYV